ncbi:DUF7848 domain-containing protein [Streptomyces sp. AC1-42W]|uniref:DUF7848 domain-containing protein n=1 Tax=Streptomyces sp. AC1-42W TaxID=2218666 RepID=UPI001F543CD3|nr:hypothetical protein [Streptomyces sp. AC1-42W]
MSRRTFRYVPFTIEQDPVAEPEYAACCVSGDEVECGACSITYNCPELVEEWQWRHAQETGHRRYRRNFGDYAVMRPPAGVVVREKAVLPVSAPCEHRKTEKRAGTTYCRECERQLYL